MSEPFLAEIRIFACNFPPSGWATCNGQLIPLYQNTALFSLLGTNFGGDGKSNFALPNFQDSAPIHWGQGVGLTNYFIGDSGGEASVTLDGTEMPVHSHPLMVSNQPGTNSHATGGVLAQAHTGRTPVKMYAPGTTTQVGMSPQALNASGGSQPHNNMPPYLALNFCIALQGVFPSRG